MVRHRRVERNEQKRKRADLPHRFANELQHDASIHRAAESQTECRARFRVIRRDGPWTSQNVRRAEGVTVAVCQLSSFPNLGDVVEVRRRRGRIDSFAHQPAKLKEIGRHAEGATQVVFRLSVLTRTMVDLDLRHAPTGACLAAASTA